MVVGTIITHTQLCVGATGLFLLIFMFQGAPQRLRPWFLVWCVYSEPPITGKLIRMERFNKERPQDFFVDYAAY
jgi:hypothetical protein